MMTLFQVEQLANEYGFLTWKLNLFLPEEKISEIPLRKLPKKTGLIRIVEVNGFDYSACGGTHCKRSGQVGLIKIIRQEKSEAISVFRLFVASGL